MSDRERFALSQAIRATVIRDGHYGAVVTGARVPQPLVSLALHQRLVMKTDKVARLFEYLQPAMASESAVETRAHRSERVERVLDLVDGLGSGHASDENIAALFAAIGNLFRSQQAEIKSNDHR